MLQANNRVAPGAGTSSGGGSLWDTIFGDDRRGGARDSTLGTPAASPARGGGSPSREKKSWLEEIFSN